jgi:hypothetical protein
LGRPKSLEVKTKKRQEKKKKNGDGKPNQKRTLPFTHVYVCLLANKVRKSSPHSLDGGQGKHDLLSSINIGIEHTQNMLKILICN